MDIVVIIVQWLDKLEPENPEKLPEEKVSLDHFKKSFQGANYLQLVFLEF